MNARLEVIKQNISMYDIVDKYGLKLNRRGAMRCPFHREKTPSFKVYQNGKKFHCFGCGEDGDVVSFVMKYYGISYGQALTRLSCDFGLSIGERKLTVKERIKIQESRQKRKQEEDFMESEFNRLFDVWMLACDEVVRLKNDLTKYAPKVLGEPYDERYCEALKMLPFRIYECDMAELKLKEFEERRSVKHERNNKGPAVYERGLSERARAI